MRIIHTFEFVTGFFFIPERSINEVITLSGKRQLPLFRVSHVTLGVYREHAGAQVFTCLPFLRQLMFLSS